MLDKLLYGVKVANDNVLVINEKVDKICSLLEKCLENTTFVLDNPKGESV